MLRVNQFDDSGPDSDPILMWTHAFLEKKTGNFWEAVWPIYTHTQNIIKFIIHNHECLML